MVFVNSDGRILKRKPWKVVAAELITGIGNVITQFFATLLAPFSQSRSQHDTTSHSSGWRSGFGSGGGGGSGSGGGPSGGGGGGPNRRIGRIVNSMDHNVPGGGCPGGGCSR